MQDVELDDEYSPRPKKPRLSTESMMHLNVRQVGIGLTEASVRFLCPNRLEGHFELGGALGNMIAIPAGMLCPICSHQIPLSDIPAETLEGAAASVAITQPELEMQAKAKAQISAYENFAQTHDYPLAFMMATSLKEYVGHVSAVRSKPKWPGPTIDAFPLTFLVAIHNLADAGSSIRDEIRQWMEKEHELRPRQHWLEAILLTDEGDLVFHKDLYSRACYRGKQETYFKSAHDQFEGLKSKLQFVSLFQGLEDGEAEKHLPSNTLFATRQLSRELQALKAMAPELKKLAQAIEGKGLQDVATALQPGLTHLALPDGNGKD
ncbi:hypothetical protein L4Z68_001357 [Pseudomonas aeruginosa]|nr:hypothetical protein [Pseudomonas aeruginosa]EKX2969364.1 hypothetical protein [Pseudomonas aeruginosa]HBO6962735.1 hypothetical protein [Pseudomonas aeruginosa]HBO7218660.1 hypothetical protein [Pseudomonas aeruginosa]HBO8004267.1 hypothetical protein [Pseudomonas aeruginosa]